MIQKTVMIVDDDEAMRDNLEDILEDEGYRLFAAASCAEAKALARQHRPQVALLDLKLPDDSGMNLLSDLKQMHPDCVCALMTAFADVDSAVMALQKGAFHYLQKPVRPIELINLLERIFETVIIRAEKRQAEEKLRDSEKRFRTIFESAQDAIFLKDRDLKYTLVNPVMERLYGLPAEDFIGNTDAQLFGTEQRSASGKSELRVLQGDIVEEDDALRVGGAEKVFHNIKVPLSDGSGEFVGLCGFARDVTATRQLEDQLLQAQKMEAIGTLAGGISHDFNNMLQAILGYSQMLLLTKRRSDADYSKLREIEKAAQRATDLTQQLLTIGRKVEIEPRPLDVNQVVRQVEKLLKRTIPKMIGIEMRLAQDIHAVNADSNQLEQVLINIGVNARDAMPDGGRLVIETLNMEPDESFRKINLNENIDSYVVLSISDTGQGMPEDVLEHIFEPFFTTKGVGEGTGLGLAMAYGIIKNHGGHISCESSPSQGTAFKIFLPAIGIAPDPVAAEPDVPVELGALETVLVIDDEPLLRDLAKGMLTGSNYEVLTADSGESGLALYRQHRDAISLVILDMIMPGMGGKQCLSEILTLNPRAKVLISSGYSMEDPAKDQILTKAKGFIKKPYNLKMMLKIMRQVLNH